MIDFISHHCHLYIIHGSSSSVLKASNTIFSYGYYDYTSNNLDFLGGKKILMKIIVLSENSFYCY